MSMANEWQERASEQLSINERIRNLALRSLTLTERAADLCNEHYGQNPEKLGDYFKTMLVILNPEKLDTISRVVDRTIQCDFKVSSQKYNDINEIAKQLDRLGYRILSKKEMQAEKPASKGYSVETVNALRSALYNNCVEGGTK